MPDTKTTVLLEELKADITARLASSQKLFDKLDTSQWPARDREALEALVDEKRQIEKQHHKNATHDLTARQRTLTSADLKAENSDFKYDYDTANYKFTGGANKCSMDGHSRGCHHEICLTAKEIGISYLEYDTIMHYKQRIAAARTTRMKDALRKQRDVQLQRDQKAGEEWRGKAIKKLGNLGKTAGDAILDAASHFAGKAWVRPTLKEDSTPDNAVEQVGRAISKLRLDGLPDFKKEFVDIVQARITGLAGTHTYHWRNPAQFVEFFASVQLSHLDAAVMNLRDILELNAVLPYELEYCLRGLLRECRDLITHVARNRRNRAGYTLGESLHDVKEIIKAMPDLSPVKSASVDKANVDEAQEAVTADYQYSTEILPKNNIYHALVTCITVEKHYCAEMMRESGASVQEKVEPDEKFKEIEKQGLADSPLPSISSRQFRYDIEAGQQYAAVHWLLDMAEKQATLIQLEEAAIQKIRIIAAGNAHQYLDTWEAISDVEDRLNRMQHEKLYSHQHGMIRTALNEAKVKLSPLIAEYDEALKKQEQRCDSTITQDAIESIHRASVDIQYLPGMEASRNCRTDVLIECARYSSKAKLDTTESGGQPNWTPLISKHIWRGITELNHVHCGSTKPESIRKDDKILSLLMRRPRKHAYKFARLQYTISSFLYDHRRDGWCLPTTMVRLLIILPYVCSFNPLRAKTVLKQLATLVNGGQVKDQIPADWVEPLRIIGTAILHTYGYLTMESTHVLGRSDVEQVVLTLLWRLMFNALIARTREDAVSNFVDGSGLLARVLKANDPAAKPWVFKMSDLIGDIIEKHEIRCETPELCAKWPGEVTSSQYDVGDSSENHESSTTVLGSVNELSGRTLIPREDTCSLKRHRTVEKSFLSHNRLLRQVVKQTDFGPLAACRVLKYLAYRLKAGAHHSSLEGLWFAFLRVQTAIDRTPNASNFASACTIPTQSKEDCMVTTATSLCLNMHNHCNIWELCASPEKACGFFEGYKHGFRTRRDINVLLESLTLYAIQHGCDSLQTKVEQVIAILSCAGLDYQCPPEITQLFKQAISLLLERVRNERNLRVRANVNWLDERLGVFPEYAKPTNESMDELLMQPRVFERYYTILVEVMQHLGSSTESIQKVETAGRALLNVAKADPYGSSIDDPAIIIIADAAEDVWRKSDHEDVIYSEPEGPKQDEADAATDEFKDEDLRQTPVQSKIGSPSVLPDHDSTDTSESENSDVADPSSNPLLATPGSVPPSEDESDSDYQSNASEFDLVNLRGDCRHAMLSSCGLIEADFETSSLPESNMTTAAEEIRTRMRKIGIAKVKQAECNPKIRKDSNVNASPGMTFNRADKTQTSRLKLTPVSIRGRASRSASASPKHGGIAATKLSSAISDIDISQPIIRPVSVNDQKHAPMPSRLVQILVPVITQPSGPTPIPASPDLKPKLESSTQMDTQGQDSAQKLQDRTPPPYPNTNTDQATALISQSSSAGQTAMSELATEQQDAVVIANGDSCASDQARTVSQRTSRRSYSPEQHSLAPESRRRQHVDMAPQTHTLQTVCNDTVDADAAEYEPSLSLSKALRTQLTALKASLGGTQASIMPGTNLHTFITSSDEGSRTLEGVHVQLRRFQGMCDEFMGTIYGHEGQDDDESMAG